MNETWKRVAIEARRGGCSPKSIVLTLAGLGSPLSSRTIYRTVAFLKDEPIRIDRQLDATQLGRILSQSFSIRNIVSGLALNTPPLATLIGEGSGRRDGAEAVWDLSGQVRKQREGRYAEDGDALPEESLSMVYYPQRGRPDGLKVYLKRQKDLNRMEQKCDDDFALEKCKVCGVKSLSEFLIDGVCEDCANKFDTKFERFHRKPKADDEKGKGR